MKPDRTTRLQRALKQLGRKSARPGDALDQVLEQTGASAAELRAALTQCDHFAADERAALEGLLDQRLTRTVAPPGAGARAHQLRAQRHSPWFLAVQDRPVLPAPLFPEPPRDVELAGKKLTRDELADWLRGAA